MSHICVVFANFYEDIADELIRGATQTLEEKASTYDLIEVPGSFEIPAAIRMAIDSKKYDGYVALGCVIRGETTHYDYVCSESARGLNLLAIEYMAAIGYGILTVETPEQAWARAAVSQGNKGKDAVVACLRMIEIRNNMNAV